jgi:hypothetical protein
MRRIAHTLHGIRFVLLTSVVIAIVAILPLVALAGDGDPHGT